MYEEYFGLNRPPFKITPDTSLFYEGGKRGDILGALAYAVHRGEGIIKVVGEVGSGKTMLCRMLQLKLPKTVEIIYIANPSVSADDILFVIAHELELNTPKDASKHEVMHMLQDYLLQRHMENRQVVLFIEEAQGMPLETLEEIRLLSNLETDQNKLLQIILFGQPELDENLAQNSIRQLRERITHQFNLSPLTPEEIYIYLNFRMREVGYTGPELISPAIAKKIERYSQGLLRRINIIADKILLSAFSESTHDLSPRHVMAAVKDSTFATDTPKKSYLIWWIASLMLLMFIFVLYRIQLNVGNVLASNPEVVVEQPVINEIPVTEKQIDEVETKILTKTANAGELEIELVSNKVEGEQLPGAAKPISVVDKPIIVTSKQDEVLPVGESEVAIAEQTELKPVKKQQESQATNAEVDLTDDYNQWLNDKLNESRKWLSNANRDGVSIQVLMRKKSAARDLVRYLRNDWPLDLEKTYLYEVNTESRNIYRVFYSEFDSYAKGQRELLFLPESVRKNSPYLHSVYRMQKALL